MKAWRVILALIAAFCVATSAHVVNAAVRPLSSESRVAAQVRWLKGAISRGAPQAMQELFPEGAFFTEVLTGLAAGRTGDRATVTKTVETISSPAFKDPFGPVPELDGGTFYRGWRLLLLTEQTRLWGNGQEALLEEARTVAAALLADPDGVPPSYVHGRWPCDAVVAMAAVVEAHRVAGADVPPGLIGDWREKIDRVRDFATNLLPHRLWGERSVNERPRGSSQAVIQAFWPTIDPVGAPAEWRIYVDRFVVREAGLVGVREYLPDVLAAPDVDSGPLLFGVSLSASAVTLAAARANGDVDLATSLDREAEFLGIPLEWSGERWFAFGQLPVGDAFVAWARTVPIREGRPAPASTAPPPLWAVLIGLPTLLAIGSGMGAFLVHRRIQQAAAESEDDDLDFGDDEDDDLADEAEAEAEDDGAYLDLDEGDP